MAHYRSKSGKTRDGVIASTTAQSAIIGQIW